MLELAGNTSHAAEKSSGDKATAVGHGGADDGSRIVDLTSAKIEIFSQGKGDVVVLLPGGSLSVN